MPDFYHLGITVRDIQKSYAFYTEIIGMTEWDYLEELDVIPPETEFRASDGPGIFTNRSEEFDKLSDQSGIELKYILLISPDGKFLLQLVEYVAGGTGPLELDHSRAGSLHFSFFVDDVEATFAELRGRGDIDFVSDQVVQITPSMRSFYIRDPDGVPVELLQVVR